MPLKSGLGWGDHWDGVCLAFSEGTSIWWPLNHCHFPSVAPAMPSPLFISVLTAGCSTRQAAAPPDSDPTLRRCQGNCYILWQHHGLACGLAGVTGLAFHLEPSVALGLVGKKQLPPPSLSSEALSDTLSIFRDFFVRPDLVCMRDVQPSTAVATIWA